MILNPNIEYQIPSERLKCQKYLEMGGWEGLVTCYYRTPVDQEPAINVDMVNNKHSKLSSFCPHNLPV